MASSYSTRLRLEKQGTGENDNTWGTKLNTVIDLVDEAIDGYLAKSVAGGSDVTLTSTNGASDESRQKVLKLTGAITANISVIVPAVEKFYIVWNSTTGHFSLTFKPSGGTGVVIPQGAIGAFYTDGSTMFFAGTLTGPFKGVTAPVPNLLPNGEFKVWQRGTSFTSATTPANNDDTYLADGCILLSVGSDTVDVERDTSTSASGVYAELKATVETANRKFGFLFPVESINSQAVIGNDASLSFKAKKGSGNVTLETIRAAIISWSGTADSITSDVVSAWGTAGTDPTLAANWTYENTPSNIVLTSTVTEYQISDINVDTSSTTNVAVFIWVDDTDATIDDTLSITDVKLEPGTLATPIDRIPFGEALRRCQRYFCKTFPYETAPAQNAGVDGSLSLIASSIGSFIFDWRLPVEMRVAPTVTTYNPSAANASARNTADSTDVAPTTTTGYTSSVASFKTTATSGSEDDPIRIHMAATAEL